MLRLPPTTIALTMLEVQTFDCQNRWANRVETERDLRLRMSSLRITSAPPSENPGLPGIIRAAELDDVPAVNTGGMNKSTSSRLLSPQPQRPVRPEQPEGNCPSHSSSGPSTMPSAIPTAPQAEVASEAGRLPTEIPRPDSTESRTATGQYFAAIVRCPETLVERCVLKLLAANRPLQIDGCHSKSGRRTDCDTGEAHARAGRSARDPENSSGTSLSGWVSALLLATTNGWNSTWEGAAVHGHPSERPTMSCRIQVPPPALRVAHIQDQNPQSTLSWGRPVYEGTHARTRTPH